MKRLFLVINFGLNYLFIINDNKRFNILNIFLLSFNNPQQIILSYWTLITINSIYTFLKFEILILRFNFLKLLLYTLQLLHQPLVLLLDLLILRQDYVIYLQLIFNFRVILFVSTAGQLLNWLKVGFRSMLRDKFIYEGTFPGVYSAAVWKARAAWILYYLHILIVYEFVAVDCVYLLISLNAVCDLHTLRIFRFFKIVYNLDFFIIGNWMRHVLKWWAVILLEGESFVLKWFDALMHFFFASLELLNIELAYTNLLVLLIIWKIILEIFLFSLNFI